MAACRPAWLLVGLLAALGCQTAPPEPDYPAWADVEPIFRGQCNGCHGWNTNQTGGGYRFDFYAITEAVCGDAALALNPGVILAGSPLATPRIKTDIETAPGAQWPRMPPQPSPAMTDWERNTLELWAEQPVEGGIPPGNHPPTIVYQEVPQTASDQLTFTAILDDPDGDSALGVIEANGYAFLMDRTGSFDVSFDTSSWPAGPVNPTAVICDGWVNTTVPAGMVQITH